MCDESIIQNILDDNQESKEDELVIDQEENEELVVELVQKPSINQVRTCLNTIKLFLQSEPNDTYDLIKQLSQTENYMDKLVLRRLQQPSIFNFLT